MTEKFNERFNITTDIDEAKRRFVNRVNNRIFNGLLIDHSRDEMNGVIDGIATKLGEEHITLYGGSYLGEIKEYTKNDFYKELQALEASFEFVKRDNESLTILIDAEIVLILNDSEVDLGVEWIDGLFYRRGAKLLDEKLVNENLHWLREQKFQNVLEPYSKALDHLMRADKYPELLSDVITDVYEALEAMAKIITGIDRDLSANQERFIKEVKASKKYKEILRIYIDYANDFRHAVIQGDTKPILLYSEVESFVYLTGIFLRLAMSKIINNKE